MNFIYKLPKLKDLTVKKNYNIILKIVNKFTKYSNIILFKEKYIVE